MQQQECRTEKKSMQNYPDLRARRHRRDDVIIYFSVDESKISMRKSCPQVDLKNKRNIFYETTRSDRIEFLNLSDSSNLFSNVCILESVCVYVLEQRMLSHVMCVLQSVVSTETQRTRHCAIDVISCSDVNH